MRPAGEYSVELDLSDRNNSHTLIVELIGPDKKVLDVGVATGYVAAALSSKGCAVTGIELDPDAARRAEEFCERVVVGDVESLDLSAELGEESFDVIVFGDVLEHLKDPQRVLEHLKTFLREEGYIVASIPNVAHGSVRLALLQGRFRYRELGLLDDTHLRFFTRESVEQLFRDSGFSIGELERTRRDVFDTEVEVDRELVAKETLSLLEGDPEARTYQFVLTAHPSGEAGTVAKLSNQVRRLSEHLSRRDEEVRGLGDVQRQLDDAHRRLAKRDHTIHELERRSRHLEELQRQLDDAHRRLAARREEVADLTQEVASRNHQLANKEKTITRLEIRLDQAQKRRQMSLQTYPQKVC